MNNHFLLLLPLVMLVMIFVSCRTPYETGRENNYQLQGVYDQTHILRLTRVANQPGRYHFESCAFKAHRVIDEGSCVPSFKNVDNASVMFALNTVKDMELSDKVKQQLIAMNESWEQYQKALSQQARGSNTASTVRGLGTGAVLVSGGVLGYKAIKAAENLSDAQSNLRVFKEWQELFGDDGFHAEMGAKELTLSAEELGENYNESKKMLESLDLRAYQVIESSLSGDTLTQLKSGYIFSDDFELFYATVRDQFKGPVSMPNHAGKALKASTEYPEYFDLLKKAVGDYYSAGHSLRQIIHPEFYDHFVTYYLRPEAGQFPIYQKLGVNFTKRGALKFAHPDLASYVTGETFLNDYRSYIALEGSSPSLVRAANLVRAYERVSHRLPSLTPKGSRSELEVAENTARQSLARSWKKAVLIPVLFVGASAAASAAILSYSGRNVPQATEEFEKTKAGFDSLQVVLKSSALTTFNAPMHEHEKVESVEQVLSALGSYLLNYWAESMEELPRIERYCVPKKNLGIFNSQKCSLISF
ncbi:MAG: hypothetical protein OXC40_04075 [Proteobacteria bacterium]|nr:hypothetical protein [Pseudomonadota bacterium]